MFLNFMLQLSEATQQSALCESILSAYRICGLESIFESETDKSLAIECNKIANRIYDDVVQPRLDKINDIKAKYNLKDGIQLGQPITLDTSVGEMKLSVRIKDLGNATYANAVDSLGGLLTIEINVAVIDQKQTLITKIAHELRHVFDKMTELKGDTRITVNKKNFMPSAYDGKISDGRKNLLNKIKDKNSEFHDPNSPLYSRIAVTPHHIPYKARKQITKMVKSSDNRDETDDTLGYWNAPSEMNARISEGYSVLAKYKSDLGHNLSAADVLNSNDPAVKTYISELFHNVVPENKKRLLKRLASIIDAVNEKM